MGFLSDILGSSKEKEEYEERVTAYIEKEKERKYTEYTGVAHFVDGESKKYTFNQMDNSETHIELIDYREPEVPWDKRHLWVKKKTIADIPHTQLKEFEIKEENRKTMKATGAIRKTRPRSEAESMVEDAKKKGRRAYIREDQE